MPDSTVAGQVAVRVRAPATPPAVTLLAGMLPTPVHVAPLSRVTRSLARRPRPLITVVVPAVSETMLAGEKLSAVGTGSGTNTRRERVSRPTTQDSGTGQEKTVTSDQCGHGRHSVEDAGISSELDAHQECVGRRRRE